MRKMDAFMGSSGVVKYTTNSNNRVPSMGVAKVYQSMSTSSEKFLIGVADENGHVLLQQNPPLYSGQQPNPLVSCSRGTVPLLVTQPFKFYNCTICGLNQYVPVNGPACIDCPDGFICLTGGSVYWPAPMYWQAPITQTIPLAVGDLMGDVYLSSFYLNYFIVTVGGVLLISFVCAIAMGFFPQKAGPWIELIDIHTTDHPCNEGDPVKCRRTVWGGYCTALYFFVMYLLIVFFLQNYFIDKYLIAQQTQLGTSTLSNPTLFIIDMTIISIDSNPGCVSVCNTLVTKYINGSLTCRLVAEESSCYLTWTTDLANQRLPFKFSLGFNFSSVHATGFYYNMRGVSYMGKDYGLSETIMADPGYAFFDNKPLVITTDLQPFTFEGVDDIEARIAPRQAAGYFSVPNSV
jgi:hypothetical protein